MNIENFAWRLKCPTLKWKQPVDHDIHRWKVSTQMLDLLSEMVLKIAVPYNAELDVCHHLKFLLNLIQCLQLLSLVFQRVISLSSSSYCHCQSCWLFFPPKECDMEDEGIEGQDFPLGNSTQLVSLTTRVLQIDKSESLLGQTMGLVTQSRVESVGITVLALVSRHCTLGQDVASLYQVS